MCPCYCCNSLSAATGICPHTASVRTALPRPATPLKISPRPPAHPRLNRQRVQQAVVLVARPQQAGLCLQSHLQQHAPLAKHAGPVTAVSRGDAIQLWGRREGRVGGGVLVQRGRALLPQAVLLIRASITPLPPISAAAPVAASVPQCRPQLTRLRTKLARASPGGGAAASRARMPSYWRVSCSGIGMQDGAVRYNSQRQQSDTGQSASHMAEFK